MKQEFTVWRLEDGSLRSSKRMQVDRAWASQAEQEDLCSIPGLISQARLHKQQQQQEHKQQQEEKPEESRGFQSSFQPSSAAAAGAQPDEFHGFRSGFQPSSGGGEQLHGFQAGFQLSSAAAGDGSHLEEFPGFQSGFQSAGAGAGGGSLFQTGTGKSVQVSNAAMKRALALLGVGEDPSPASDATTTPPSFKKSNVGNEPALFQTATGKSVSVSASAMDKARSLLQAKDAPKSAPGFSFTSASSLRKLPASVPPFKHPRRRTFTSPVTPSTQDLHKKVAPAPALTELQFRLWTPMAKELELVPRGKEFKMPLRVNIRQFFQHPPYHFTKDDIHVPREILSMTSDSARSFTFFSENRTKQIGALAFREMLLESGAKPHLATNDWVENHYRWIVWKLASQQRSYPERAKGFLTIENVFCELKYRYLREIGYGHRSVLKKVCERDASAAQPMILCVSAIRKGPTFDPSGFISQTARVEVTDGWYCLNAILDVPLTQKLQTGKLFVGQKLKVSEAQLHGAEGGLPPLEAYDVCSFALHMNGTFRAEWADRLGRCKLRCSPLAFKSIKADGGSVTSTLVGVTRIYPLLYRERLDDNMSVVRHARAEQSAQNSYEHRRAAVIEDVVSRVEKHQSPDSDELNPEEGARLLHAIESAADPELVMADMSAEEHAILSAYQQKLKLQKQTFVEEQIQKALKDSHLHSRSVTRFLKLSVMSLQRDSSGSREGFITVWDPSDSLIAELVEGATYVVHGLRPAPVSSGLLHLSANKSSRWRKFNDDSMKWSFKPRSGTQVSMLAEVPVYSEFDTAALILHVGDVFSSGNRRRQWIFATDGSMQQTHVSLLAIDISASADHFSAFESSYNGTVVGLCNLTKQHYDERNSMWVASASNMTMYSSKLNTKNYFHLCKPAALVTRWMKSSPQLVSCLEQRVLDILCEDD